MMKQATQLLALGVRSFMGVSAVAIGLSSTVVSAQGPNPFVGIGWQRGSSSESGQQAIVARDGTTYVSFYAWPSYVQAAWAPGPNVFDSAGGCGVRIITDVTNHFALGVDGAIYEAPGGFGGWQCVGNVASSAGVPNLGDFVGLWHGMNPDIGGYPYAVTTSGQIYRSSRKDGTGWEVVRLPDLPTGSRAQSWGATKSHYR